MAEFRSPAEFREVMDRVFTIMSTDPEMGPKLRDARVPQRFEFPDQDAVVNITFDDSGGDQNLRWVWSDGVDWDPQVEMTMNSDVANMRSRGNQRSSRRCMRSHVRRVRWLRRRSARHQCLTACAWKAATASMLPGTA